MNQSGYRIQVNRAPVLTLWAAVVAECMGYDEDEALTIGRAIAGQETYAAGVSLGIFDAIPEHIAEDYRRRVHAASVNFSLLCRALPAVRTKDGLRGIAPHGMIEPADVRAYLGERFGDALGNAREAMSELARSLPLEDLREAAYGLYTSFRPEVPNGRTGWGARGVLDLNRVRRLAHSPAGNPA